MNCWASTGFFEGVLVPTTATVKFPVLVEGEVSQEYTTNPLLSAVFEVEMVGVVLPALVMLIVTISVGK